jgi:hypothetical protein
MPALGAESGEQGVYFGRSRPARRALNALENVEREQLRQDRDRDQVLDEQRATDRRRAAVALPNVRCGEPKGRWQGHAARPRRARAAAARPSYARCSGGGERHRDEALSLPKVRRGDHRRPRVSSEAQAVLGAGDRVGAGAVWRVEHGGTRRARAREPMACHRRPQRGALGDARAVDTQRPSAEAVSARPCMSRSLHASAGGRARGDDARGAVSEPVLDGAAVRARVLWRRAGFVRAHSRRVARTFTHPT